MGHGLEKTEMISRIDFFPYLFLESLRIWVYSQLALYILQESRAIRWGVFQLFTPPQLWEMN